MVQAYDNRVNADWQQTRLLVYTIACTVTEADKRIDMYDMMPLKGDPSPEERMANIKAEYDAVMQDQKEFTQSLRAEKADKK